MWNTATSLALGCLLSFQADDGAAQDDQYIATLISQLDGLHEDATRQEFLQRPAFMELLSLAGRPIPELGRALKSRSWSIRISALYVILSHGDERAAGLYVPNLLHDPHPAVRAGAIGWAGISVASQFLKDLTVETVYVDRWGLRPDHSLDWLPDRYYSQRLENYATVLATHPPFEDAPVPHSPEEWVESPTPGAISAAKLAFQNELASNRGHLAANRLLQLAHQLGPSQENQLAHILEAASSIPRHHDQLDATPSGCALESRFSERLCSLLEGRVWGTYNPSLRERGLMLLGAISHYKDEQVLALIRRFAEEHPDQQVRDRAQRIWHRARESQRPAIDNPAPASLVRSSIATATDTPSDRLTGIRSADPLPRGLPVPEQGARPSIWAVCMIVAILVVLILLSTRRARKVGIR